MKFWLTADKDGSKIIHTSDPRRCENTWFGNAKGDFVIVDGDCFEGDAKLENLTWEDEPVEIEVYWINSMNFKTKQK